MLNNTKDDTYVPLVDASDIMGDDDYYMVTVGRKHKKTGAGKYFRENRFLMDNLGTFSIINGSWWSLLILLR